VIQRCYTHYSCYSATVEEAKVRWRDCNTVATRGHWCGMLSVSKRGRYTMEKAYALVTVRDINLLCQYYKTYAQIEGRARRRKITRARRRNGVLEVRTAARDEWVQPVAWIEWINDRGVPIRYMVQDIR
jgi:hypothetical protein